STTWVLNALRNEAILGKYPSGLNVKNPMCYPMFQEIVGPFNYAGTPVQVSTVNGGNVLNVEGCSSTNGANVQVWAPDSNLCQQWTFNFKCAGEYEIRSVKSNLALEVQDSSLINGANVRQWTPNGMPEQTWLVQPLGNNQYRIISKLSGKSLDIAGCSTIEGTNVQQWTWNGANCQKWVLSNAVSSQVTGVSTPKMTTDFNVYPNPATGSFQIQVLGNAVGQVSMFDSFGQLVSKFNDAEGTITLNTGHFEKGIYVIQLVIDGRIERKKLMVE
ncbi:MAG TPA: RICIN domain-containing protein, partial [Cytophagaceae bacterium]|nr:RICIN domain-containing protein [Cytophagaceae bacterium]